MSNKALISPSRLPWQLCCLQHSEGELRPMRPWGHTTSLRTGWLSPGQLGRCGRALSTAGMAVWGLLRSHGWKQREKEFQIYLSKRFVQVASTAWQKSATKLRAAFRLLLSWRKTSRCIICCNLKTEVKHRGIMTWLKPCRGPLTMVGCERWCPDH